ncbi:ribokinase [Ahrensia kielensis]|uniref:ribokinase n=1 Tax=Ahrensia kielensis TaxID=76980 RepID=UPI00039C067E|nr:ribokinase [Ahrensia kielensis]
MIIVVGSINLDLIARVKKIPLPGETVSGSSFASAPGGKGANQALAARRAGADVSMIGAVGEDANAEPALALLKSAGVDLGGVAAITEGDISTGVAMILVDETSGENQIAVIAGANACVDGDSLKGASIKADDIVVLQMEVPDAANLAAIKAAQEAGARSILNIAPYGEGAVELAKHADITIANETEFDDLSQALNLSGNDRREKAHAFCQTFGKGLIITLGADGALAIIDGKEYSAKSPKIEAVDTVGAGDTFCGALAVALSEGQPVEAVLKFACAAGALACLQAGAQPAIPLRADIDKMIA